MNRDNQEKDRYCYLKEKFSNGKLDIKDISLEDGIIICKYETILDNNKDMQFINFVSKRFDLEKDSKQWKLKAFMTSLSYGTLVGFRYYRNKSLKFVGSASIIIFITFTGTHAIGKASLREYFDSMNNSIKQTFLYISNVFNGEKSESHNLFNRLPKDYQLSEFSRDTTNKSYGNSYISDYVNTNGDIVSLEIQEYVKPNWTTAIETDGEIETFIHNNDTYYMVTNYDYNKITWERGERIYILYSKISFDELKEFIYLNEK